MTTHETDDSLNLALRHFALAEANFGQDRAASSTITKIVPQGFVFGSNAQYDDACRGYAELLDGLPKIDGWVIKRQVPV
jgi:hypothetical protein